MPKQEKVTVEVDYGQNGGLDFKMVGPCANGDVLTFRNDANDDGVLIEFTIHDKTGQGFVFPDDLDEAFAVKKITNKSKCPKKFDRWSEVKPVSVSNHNRTLTVANLNSYLQYFGFAMWVTLDPQNGPYIPYDPIGNNQNGGVAF